jgi:hypothetical protein
MVPCSPIAQDAGQGTVAPVNGNYHPASIETGLIMDTSKEDWQLGIGWDGLQISGIMTISIEPCRQPSNS